MAAPPTESPSHTGPVLGMRSGVALLDDEALWSRMQTRIVREHGVPEFMAHRILDQTLCFLALCAEAPGTGYAPSSYVDMGWDVFISYTQAYTQWCLTHAGRYLHHHPNDNPDLALVEGVHILSPPDTAEALRRAGFLVDRELWPATESAGCTNCYSGDHEGSPER